MRIQARLPADLMVPVVQQQPDFKSGLGHVLARMPHVPFRSDAGVWHGYPTYMSAWVLGGPGFQGSLATYLDVSMCNLWMGLCKGCLNISQLVLIS